MFNKKLDYGCVVRLFDTDCTRMFVMKFNNDFRGLYATLLDQWMGLDSSTILNDNYEQFDLFRR